nr:MULTISPECIES: YueH family protein [Staphylococcus]
MVVVQVKIRESHSEHLSVKVWLYHNKGEGYILVSIPDLHWSIQVDDTMFGETLTEHLLMHLFNVIDEQEAEVLALRITRWIQEV